MLTAPIASLSRRPSCISRSHTVAGDPQACRHCAKAAKPQTDERSSIRIQLQQSKAMAKPKVTTESPTPV